MSIAIVKSFVQANPFRRKRRRPYYTEAPKVALTALRAAAKRDREIERRLFAFLRWLSGDSRRKDEVGPGNVAAFPLKLQPHAQRLMRWATRTDCSLTLLMLFRCRVRDDYLTHLAASPRGQRARRLARSVATHRTHQDAGEAAPGRMALFPEYEERLLSPGIVRTLAQVTPQFVVAGDGLPKLNGQMPHGAVVVWLSHGCIINRIELATSSRGADLKEPIYGKLGYEYEMGGCGAQWVITEDDGFLHDLRAGEHLTIFNADETKVLWKGRIVPSSKAGLARNRQGWMQPRALDHWITWTQKGFRPDAWARFFFQPAGVPFRGRLVRA